jgi:hypothetical protein
MQETQIFTRTNKNGPNILDFFEYFLDPAFKPLRARLGLEEFGEDDEDEEEEGRKAGRTPPASTARGLGPAQGPPQSSVAQQPRPGKEATKPTSSATGPPATKPTSSATGRPATPAQQATSTALTYNPQSTASKLEPFSGRQVKTDEDPWPYKVNAKGEPILATLDDMRELLPHTSRQELYIATVKHNDKILRQYIVSSPGMAHHIADEEGQQAWDREHEEQRGYEFKANGIRLAQEEEKTRRVYDRTTGKQVPWGTCVEAIRAEAKAEAKKKLWSEWCELYGIDPKDGPPKKRARVEDAPAEDSDSTITTPTPVVESPKPGN